MRWLIAAGVLGVILGACGKEAAEGEACADSDECADGLHCMVPMDAEEGSTDMECMSHESMGGDTEEEDAM